MSSTKAATPRNTLVFYFTHNLDASLAAKSLQTAMLNSDSRNVCQLVPLSIAYPDRNIAASAKSTEGLTDICVMGYCPEDFTTLDLVESYSGLNLTYFLYEHNIQMGNKLVTELTKAGLRSQVSVYKPSSFKTDGIPPCGNSICAMMLEISGHNQAIDSGVGCRTAMAAVNRWYSRDETSMQDLKIAWALRYDEEVRDKFAGSEIDLTVAVGMQCVETTARTRALVAAIYNTMAIRLLVISESFKFKNTVNKFRTVVVDADHIHDTYRRLIVLWDNFIIVSRVSDSINEEGYLVSLSVEEPRMRSIMMQELGINKFWMEGDSAVGFTKTNPLH